MPQPKGITADKQLVVEGDDARVFFEALLRHLALLDVQVQNFGGISEFRYFLNALRGTHGFLERVASLGIVRDADQHPSRAFQSVCDALRDSEFDVPSRPETFIGSEPRVGVMILPDSTTPGSLETICLRAVASDSVMDCIDDYSACIDAKRGSPLHDKGRVQTFLASRARAGLRLGEAAHAGHWPWASAAFDHVKTFLRAL